MYKVLSKEEFFKKIYYQKTEGLCVEDIYKSFFEEIIHRLEKNRKYYAVIGNIDGSISRGINNNTSDVDMHLFGITEDEKIVYELFAEPATINGSEYIYDLSVHVFDATIKALETYNAIEKKYPTVFYRTEEEKQIYSSNNLHWNGRYRPDGEIYELSQLLLADTIFVNKRYMNLVDLKEFYTRFKTIDVMDLQFVRAYGNYNNLMKDGQEFVLVRKYLYTLYEIFCCNYIIERHGKPPQIFMELLNGQQISEAVREEVIDVYRLNYISKKHKTENKCKSIALLNNYIRDSLIDLKEKMAVYDKGESWYELVKEEQSLKPIVFYYE